MIENQDDRPHAVGIRFLLDTFIGTNDGVPFTIAGELCDTSRDFKPPLAIPDSILALEYDDLKSPGTVALLRLKLEGLEPPGRVILGAWPDEYLKKLQGRPLAQGQNTQSARAQNTLWEVPVLSMKTLFPYDSAITIYWDEKPLAPRQQRAVGFAYGLGNVARSSKLLLTASGSFKPGGAFTVTALVSHPEKGETVTLTVPEGFQIDGDARQKVPELTGAVSSRNRPVTWRVQAGPRVGDYHLTVKSSIGAMQMQRVTIKERGILD
jgi:hypothetical protein